MKKYIFAFLFLLCTPMLSLASEKDSSFSSAYGGVNTISYSGDIQQKSSAYLGLDVIPKLSDSNFGIGVGADINWLGSAGKSTGNYTMGCHVSLAYSFYETLGYPVHIKAISGYGVSRFYDKNYWGFQYGAYIDMPIYKNIGVGGGYKYVNIGHPLTESYGATLLYINITL